MLYAGLDLSRQRLDVHVLDEAGLRGCRAGQERRRAGPATGPERAAARG
jgi:hypothetical protein